ncbi:MAG TPA: class I adenylate-forming enzyme family protein [Thermoleophilia bacterium]|nr:class I adenylate-forming enzyme family protein [Thermoleophilia bacterium]
MVAMPALMTDAVARLAEHAERRPDSLLLATRGREYAYADFARRADAVAAALRAAGLAPARRVALFLEEYDQFFVAMFGVWLAGGVVVPLNTSLPRRDVDGLLVKSSPDLVVVPDEATLPDVGLPRLVVRTDAGGLVDGLEPAGGAAPAGGLAGAAAPAAGLDAAGSPAGGLDGASSPVGPDELAMLMFTSGTTGVPKAVCQTLRALSSNPGYVAQVLGLGAGDRIFINTPPYFTSGICHFLTLMAHGGGTAGQLGFYFGEGLLDEMERLGCSGFGGAPAHLVRVVEPLEGPRATGLRFWVSSGDHLPLPVIERFRRLLPAVALFNMYGLTEVSGRLCVLPPGELDARPGSVGRPIGDMRVRALDAEGRELPPGETGELYVTGSLLMQGYLDEPGITARTLTAHGLRSGDFGHVDADGYVWIAGRKDDIIKRGGEKVSTVHVQQALMALERFADVAVIAAPDEILGHVPVAFVVPLEPEGFKATRVLRELRDLLPSSSLPSRIVAVREIPRTGSGKAVRAELRALLEAAG